MHDKVELDCTTCEFLVAGVCTHHKGIHGRGWKPQETNLEKVCWSMSFEYFMKIVTQMPDYEQQFIRHNEHITVNDLIYRIQAGYWKPQLLKKSKIVSGSTEPASYLDLQTYV